MRFVFLLWCLMLTSSLVSANGDDLDATMNKDSP